MFTGFGSIFSDIELIEHLKTIVNTMEDAHKYKMMLYAFILETNKIPEECDCENGLDRLNCPKCQGTGYYLKDYDGKEIKL